MGKQPRQRQRKETAPRAQKDRGFALAKRAPARRRKVAAFAKPPSATASRGLRRARGSEVRDQKSARSAVSRCAWRYDWSSGGCLSREETCAPENTRSLGVLRGWGMFTISFCDVHLGYIRRECAEQANYWCDLLSGEVSYYEEHRSNDNHGHGERGAGSLSGRCFLHHKHSHRYDDQETERQD